MGAEDQEKKIIVDEDWKAQVEAEKEAALHAEAAVGAEAAPAADADSEPTAGADSEPTAGADAEPMAGADAEPTAGADAEPEAGTDAGDKVPQGADEDFPLPPPSFALLVSSFATQALAAMGQIPDPVEGKPVMRLPVARHFIDSLAVLEEKTRGNLTAEEARMLDDALHQLRMAFVAVQRSAAPAPPESAESTP